MGECIRQNLITILEIFLVIIATHTLFFIIYGYVMGGDSLIALKNFYNTIYNIRW